MLRLEPSEATCSRQASLRRERTVSPMRWSRNIESQAIVANTDDRPFDGLAAKRDRSKLLQALPRAPRYDAFCFELAESSIDPFAIRRDRAEARDGHPPSSYGD